MILELQSAPIVLSNFLKYIFFQACVFVAAVALCYWHKTNVLGQTPYCDKKLVKFNKKNTDFPLKNNYSKTFNTILWHT